MRRRTTMVAGLATACLLLGGCGSGSSAGTKPDAAPDDVATDIAPPKPTAAQTFAGQSLSEADTDRLSESLTAALREGDKKAFLSAFDPARTALVAQQSTWFDNVRRVPMKDRRMFLVKARDTRDSSGRGRLSADMGFQHQITGADSAPLSEWYTFDFRKQGSKLLVTRVTGAPADESTGEKYSRYYRQPWDDGPMAVVRGRKTILLGPEGDTATMRGLAGRLDDAVETEIRRFTRARAKLAGDVRSRKWVFMMQAPQVTNLFDYLGGEVKPREADFLAFTMPVFLSDTSTGSVDAESDVHVSRIVLDREAVSRADLATTIRHEMVHALEQTWQQGYGSAPRWAVEGAAVALSSPSASDLGYRRDRGLGYLRSHDHLPTDTEFYKGDNDEVSSHYGAGYLACAYVIEKRGEAGLLEALRAMDKVGWRPETVLGMSEEKFTKEVRAWAS